MIFDFNFFFLISVFLLKIALVVWQREPVGVASICGQSENDLNVENSQLLATTWHKVVALLRESINCSQRTAFQPVVFALKLNNRSMPH